MDLVVDTSVVLAVILGEPEREALIAATVDHSLVGPDCIPSEVGNAFSALMKRGRLDLSRSLDGLRAFASVPLRLLPIDLPAALTIASRRRIYAYDAYFIDCALRTGAPLMTLDRRLAAAAAASGANVMEL